MPRGGPRARSGPKPKPTKLKLLEGNPGQRPINDKEPQPKERLPQCPPHLSEEAKREWQRTGKRLLKLGLISEIDRAAFAAYCQAWGRWVEAETNLKEQGMVFHAPKNNYPMPSPYLSIANKSMDQMTKYLVEFGMTPSSRSRLSVEKEEYDSGYGSTLNGNWKPDK